MLAFKGHAMPPGLDANLSPHVPLNLGPVRARCVVDKVALG